MRYFPSASRGVLLLLYVDTAIRLTGSSKGVMPTFRLASRNKSTRVWLKKSGRAITADCILMLCLVRASSCSRVRISTNASFTSFSVNSPSSDLLALRSRAVMLR